MTNRNAPHQAHGNREYSLVSASSSFFAVLLAPFLALSLGGCSEASSPPPLGAYSPSNVPGIQEGPCEPGVERECSVVHQQENGVTSCWKGEQFCDEGRWSPCQESLGEKESMALPSLELSAVSASSCSFNPCDPGCMVFDDPETVLIPDSGEPDGTLDFPDLPPWKNEPCETGADCQLNHRCEEVSTDASCSHSKCQTGAALVPSCDPCVERICSANPACCTEDGDALSDEWDATCIALVQTECDATCGETSSPSCAAPTPVGGWGSGENRCDYALMGSGALAIYGASLLGGDVGGGTGANALVELYGLRPQVSHSIYSQGSLDLYRADVGGDVRAGGALDTGRCADRVAGVCVAGASVPAPVVPTRSFSCAGGSSFLDADGAFPSGSYGDVTVAPGVELSLEAGVYRLARLSLGDGASLVLPAVGTVEFELCGDLSLGRDVQVGVTGDAKDALRLLIYSNGDVSLGGRSHLAALVTAPTGRGYLDQGEVAQVTQITGLLHVATATLMPHSVIDATGLSGAACAAALEPCVPTGGGELADQGACVPQEVGDVDLSCAAYDLALGVPCGEEVTVCNHGVLAAPSGLELSFFEASSGQFALESPDPAFLIGSCALTVPVPAGECVVQNCAAGQSGQDALVMVNVGRASGADECSLLDNWSLLDASRSCGSALRMSETRIYEAECPPDRVASWGLLTWDTATPDQSAVSWSARVAENVADLDAQTWTELGRAEAEGEDTQVCSGLSGQSGCPVDITGTLPLLQVEARVLELGIDLLPGAGAPPQVNDFRVTYSCVEDQ